MKLEIKIKNVTNTKTIFCRPNLKMKKITNVKNVITDEVFSPVIITPISKIIENINI